MIDKIKADAPSGATHYGFRENGIVVYFKYFMGSLCKYSRPTKSFYKCQSTIDIKPL